MQNTERNAFDLKVSSEDILSISREEVNVENKIYPSVTMILSETMSASSQAALRRWQKNMIKELGEEGFLQLCEDQLARGRLFHSTMKDYLFGTPESQLKLSPEVEGCWASLQAVLPSINNVKALESHLVHPKLMYRGVVDCVASYRGKLLLIEWKHSDKQKENIYKTYDAPIQLSAYLGALNFDENYKFKVKGGLVVVAYNDGSPAHIFPLSIVDCKRYWAAWLKRLQNFWHQR